MHLKNYLENIFHQISKRIYWTNYWTEFVEPAIEAPEISCMLSNIFLTQKKIYIIRVVVAYSFHLRWQPSARETTWSSWCSVFDPGTLWRKQIVLAATDHFNYDRVSPTYDVRSIGNQLQCYNLFILTIPFASTDLTCLHSALSQCCSEDHGQIRIHTLDLDPHVLLLGNYLTNLHN